ncbi:MAG: hypothetical protein H5U11_15375 [Rhizobium sp.]|nr:hypothetical protein [Rhizobium sp.]
MAVGDNRRSSDRLFLPRGAVTIGCGELGDELPGGRRRQLVEIGAGGNVRQARAQSEGLRHHGHAQLRGAGDGKHRIGGLADDGNRRTCRVALALELEQPVEILRAAVIDIIEAGNRHVVPVDGPVAIARVAHQRVENPCPMTGRTLDIGGVKDRR